MSDPSSMPPDYAALAKRYLDLWQEQLGKLARDQSQMSAAADMWSQFAAAMTPGAGARYEPAATAPGAQTNASPPGHGSMDAAGLLGRIAELERRVAALESDAKSGRHAVAPRKPISKSVSKSKPRAVAAKPGSRKARRSRGGRKKR